MRAFARSGLSIAVAAALTAALPQPVEPQDGGGSTEAALGAGLVGAYSGGMLSLAGSLIPCGQTMAGPTCSAWVAGVGSALGAAGGLALGAGDSDALVSRVEAGLLGAAAGGVMGYVLKGVVRQYGWLDVASGAALGLAIGSSVRGAALGFGAGALAGGALLATVPSVRITDTVAVTLAGMAIGGVVGWVEGGVRAQREGDSPPVLLSVAVPW